MKRLRIDFDEVIKFRIYFNFGKFGSNHNKKDFEKVVDKNICKRLIDTNNFYDLKQLCETLKEKTDGNQEFLFKYIKELLEDKWPKNTKKLDETQFGIEELEFALKWESFLNLEEIHLNHVAKGYSLPLDPNSWLDSFNNLCSLFCQCIENVASGLATIQIVKLVHANKEKANKMTKFLVEKNLTGKFCFNKSNLGLFDNLVEIRMKECVEFENYRSNLKAFVQVCNNFRQVNVKAYEIQLDDLEKMVNVFDKQTKLSSVCSVLNFEVELKEIFSKSSGANEEIKKFMPKIIYFLDINQTNMPIIIEIINLDRSCCVIFDSYFSESCDKIKEIHSTKHTELNIEHVINEVWPLTRRKWQIITNNIQDGRIKLIELDEILRFYFKESYPKMIKELIYMNNYFKIRNLELRNEQIE